MSYHHHNHHHHIELRCCNIFQIIQYIRIHSQRIRYVSLIIKLYKFEHRICYSYTSWLRIIIIERNCSSKYAVRKISNIFILAFFSGPVLEQTIKKERVVCAFHLKLSFTLNLIYNRCCEMKSARIVVYSNYFRTENYSLSKSLR